jgi:BirA family transcriptional regulator, biotin operon repressor / biotin---[acetyl-CoA-carboxylase] ligase
VVDFCGFHADNSAIAKTQPIRRLAPDLIAPDGHTDERLGRVVHLLGENALVVVSGTKIAEEIGVTRSAVWRLIEQLRSLGVEIAGHPATGYQLESVPDLLLPEFLSPLLRGCRFNDLRHYFKIGSTNATAMQAAAEGAAEGTVFVAEEQTAGRGRGGHDWLSQRSMGIYCSVVLRPKVGPAEILMLSLLSGLAVAGAVESVTGVRPDLRWPNDLLLADRKFCGILAEMNAEATRVRYAVVGIGVNVNQQEFPADLAEVATSLRQRTGRAWSRVELAAALLKSLDREYARLGGDSREVIARFEAACSTARGARVRVEENGGFEGTTEGLDERGFLRVRTEAGIRTVLSGGVRPVSRS